MLFHRRSQPTAARSGLKRIFPVLEEPAIRQSGRAPHPAAPVIGAHSVTRSPYTNDCPVLRHII
eukprot:10339406-Alexandrium_andersonii.AAC.1